MATSNKPTPNKAVTDETDVDAALARKTQDGKGEGDVPPADFESFTSGATEDKSDADAIRDAVAQALRGNWGNTRVEAVNKLVDNGFDREEIEHEISRRLSAGAPSAWL